MSKPDYEPLIVEFEIYVRYKIECGFPKKCGEMTTEELERNGVCGVEKFVNTPIKIDRTGLSKEFQKDNYADVKLEFSNWKNKLSNALEDAWDYTKNLAANTWNKTVTMENFIDVANTMFPAMDFIPTECLKTICQAQRQAAGQNSIADLSDGLKNKVNSTELLIKDVSKQMSDAASKTIEGIGELGSTAFEGLKNLYDTFNIYQLCPRRYSDWLNDAADAMRFTTRY